MKHPRRYVPALLGALLLSIVGTHADVRLPNVISDNMVIQRDKPIQIWGWAKRREKVTVTFKGSEVKTRADKSNNWHVTFPPMPADAEPATLSIKGRNRIAVTNILVGDVWLCSGQSNMKWPLHATQTARHETNDYPNIRLCTISKWQLGAPAKDTPTSWKACANHDRNGFSAVGYHFGKVIHESLDVPIGLIQAAVDGSSTEPWIPLAGYDSDPLLKEHSDEIRARTASYQAHFWSPGSFHNGMIYPLQPLGMRGILWYQGESNVYEGDTDVHLNKLRALIHGWRDGFKQPELPFYYVQIAPYTYHGGRPTLPPDSLPRFWEAQLAAMQTITNSGMAFISDVTYNTRDIHPRHKRSVGQRLARWALAKDYGQTNLVYSGPIYRSMVVEGDKAILSFDYADGGLACREGARVTAVTMAGADQIFRPAVATIVGDRLHVSSPYVDAPVAARYAWHESTVGNLCNKDGLPAFPFRTDEFHNFVHPLLTHPLRDTAVSTDTQNVAYLTGTTGHPGWMNTNIGIHVWSSSNLEGWHDHKLVWNIESNGTWQVDAQNDMRAVRAPEVHFIKGTFWLPYSMNYGGTGILKSESGKIEGPYRDIKADGPLTDGYDASLFQDDDGAVYFVYSNGMIARMKDDMSGLAETPQLLKPANADQVGTTGASIQKIEGSYYLLVADETTDTDGQKTSHCMAAMSETLFGPYGDRYIAIPHAGQASLFQDRFGEWWATFSGNDNKATFRDRAGILPIILGEDGHIRPRMRTGLRKPPLEPNQTLIPKAGQTQAQWRYTFTAPQDNWFAPAFDDTRWQQGTNGFGTELSNQSKVGTIWDTSDIWLRRSFTAQEDIEGMLFLHVQHDEDAHVYINGVHAAHVPGYSPTYQRYAVSAEAAMTVKPGLNTIAIHCHQTAGGQYIDISLMTMTD
jgi:sialate O-acetylesterase